MSMRFHVLTRILVSWIGTSAMLAHAEVEPVTEISRAPAQSSERSQSGADQEIGWIIRKTKGGIVKIPKKQIFRFGDTDIGAGIEKPFDSSLGKREAPSRRSLIPVRQSFRKEMLDSVGLGQ